MTACLPTQPEIFNQFRLKTERREKIALEIAKRRKEMLRIAGEIAELSAEDAEIQVTVAELLDQLDANGAIKPVLLDFDSDGKTIRWKGKSVQLGWNPRNIVKVLYFATNRRATITGLGKAIWGDQLCNHKTIKATISKLNRALKKTSFPYKIKSVKSKKQVVSVEDFLSKKVRSVTIRCPIVGYKLVARK